MTRDFLRIFKRPTNLLEELRKVLVGGMIATTGVVSPTAAVSESPAVIPSHGLPLTLVDRSRKAAKLVLQLPGTAKFLPAAHRSHRSHSSHRSHYSGSSGGGSTVAPAPTTAPAPPPAPAAAAVPPPTRSTAPVTAAELVPSTPAASTTMSGVVAAIDAIGRKVTIREGASAMTTFGYRDDSKILTAAGVAVRFDDFSEASGGQFPIAIRDKVQVTWRTTTGGSRIISTISRIP